MFDHERVTELAEVGVSHTTLYPKLPEDGRQIFIQGIAQLVEITGERYDRRINSMHSITEVLNQLNTPPVGEQYGLVTALRRRLEEFTVTNRYGCEAGIRSGYGNTLKMLINNVDTIAELRKIQKRAARISTAPQEGRQLHLDTVASPSLQRTTLRAFKYNNNYTP